MDTMLHIGAKIDADAVEHLAAFVERTFRSARANQMDQATVVEALKLWPSAVTPQGVTVSNCSFTSEPEPDDFSSAE